jgi:hypothetical protein
MVIDKDVSAYILQVSVKRKITIRIDGMAMPDSEKRPTKTGFAV